MNLTWLSEQKQQQSSTEVIFQWNIKQKEKDISKHYQNEHQNKKKEARCKQYVKTQVRENNLRKSAHQLFTPADYFGVLWIV